MLKTNNNLIEIFETERWLYVDGSLDDKRKTFWDNQIKNSSELQSLLFEVRNFQSEINNKFYSDLDDDRFNTIMKNVFEVRKQNLFQLLPKKLFTWKSRESKLSNSKLAFAGGILFAVISFVLLLNQPLSNHTINPKLLAWNDTSFSKTLSVVEFEYTNIADDKVTQYIQYQLANDKWLRDVVLINNEIDRLSTKTDNKSL